MSAGAWSELETIPAAYKLIQERGLVKNLEELETYGLTVITPEQIGEPRLVDRAREAFLRVAEKRTGVKHDVETGEHGNLEIPGSYPGHFLRRYLGFPGRPRTRAVERAGGLT